MIQDLNIQFIFHMSYLKVVLTMFVYFQKDAQVPQSMFKKTKKYAKMCLGLMVVNYILNHLCIIYAP